MSLLAMTEGVSIITAMLVVGCIFLATILIGELTHHYATKRAQRRRARKAVS
jgi:hypothetical protein